MTKARSAAPASGLVPLRILWGAAGVFIACFVILATTSRQQSPSDATRSYIAELDLGRFERKGMCCTDPEVSPYRILPVLTEHDRTYLYDYDRVSAIEARLRSVNRREALRAIFARATAGATNDRDRHLAVLRFLHRASFHNLIQPIYPNGMTVSDPLVLLELGEMRCGHVNRVAIDLFQAMGYRGRLVQAASHLLAEIWYDNSWHYFDGDIFGNGECVVLPDGHIPSMNELARHAGQLDALISYWEPDHLNSIKGPTPYPSWFYFGARAYRASHTVPSYIEKYATPEQEDESPYYGWEYERTTPDPERPLDANVEQRFTPGPPRITAVHCSYEGTCRQISIEWRPDPRAAGYRVFVSTISRGWNYDGASLPADLLKWKSSAASWTPEMYAPRFHLPPSDLKWIETPETSITIRIPPRAPAFVTVMGYDAYGQSVGRQLYPVSEELRLP